jgi:hypothetical protein
MKNIFLSFILFFLYIEQSLAADITTGIQPDTALLPKWGKSFGLLEILSIAEEFLLKVALPLVIIGSSLYVAYELFLAEGNEEKVKKAWKSLTYGAMGAICIAFGYAIISFVSRLAI